MVVLVSVSLSTLVPSSATTQVPVTVVHPGAGLPTVSWLKLSENNGVAAAALPAVARAAITGAASDSPSRRADRDWWWIPQGQPPVEFDGQGRRGPPVTRARSLRGERGGLGVDRRRFMAVR